MKFEKVSIENFTKAYVSKEAASADYKNVKLPQRATPGSAGYDFYSPLTITIKPGTSATIPTGIKCDLDADKVLMIYPRSSFGFKYGVMLANTVGIIDCDYYDNSDNEGNIIVKLTNNGSKELEIKAGDRFCQGIITQFFVVDKDIALKKKRKGGIGSTSK